MADERRFRSLQEAARFMETEIDRPVAMRETNLGSGLMLRTSPLSFADGGFTNIYDLSWKPSATTAAVRFTPRPTTAIDAARHAPATSTAAFFTLLDETSGLPVQTSLNLAVEQGRILSMPVVVREALVSRAGVLSTCNLTAAGTVMINGVELTWTGSLTGRQAECYAFGNGNMVITRRNDPEKGSVRVLDEASRVTPALGRAAGSQRIPSTRTGRSMSYRRLRTAGRPGWRFSRTPWAEPIYGCSTAVRAPLSSRALPRRRHETPSRLTQGSAGAASSTGARRPRCGQP
ncbi:hypothetical protein [Salinispora oceanensis]|uniref:hypothetical protein n=1 Tax=Salinispora oceanensis TaxID=1050199 RepID=UPI0013A5464F|nr:hypothetical protein [Salinispora oceanensis]